MELEAPAFEGHSHVLLKGEVMVVPSMFQLLNWFSQVIILHVMPIDHGQQS
jgi:hypothetical protein